MYALSPKALSLSLSLSVFVCVCVCILERPCVVARGNARFRVRDGRIVYGTDHLQAQVLATGCWRTESCSWVRWTCLYQPFEERRSTSAGVFFFWARHTKILKSQYLVQLCCKVNMY